MSEEIKKLEEKSTGIIKQANEIVIISQQQYTAAGVFLKGVKGLMKEINATFDPIVKKAHEAHKEAKAQQKKHLDPLESAERTIKGKMSNYYLEQERKRQEEQAKRDEQARREEQKRKQELDEQAKKWEEKGKHEKAEERRALKEDVMIDAPIVAPQVEEVEGVSMREMWDFAIIDETQIPREYLIPDEKAIRQVVKAMKAKTNIPGVKVFSKKVVAA